MGNPQKIIKSIAVPFSNIVSQSNRALPSKATDIATRLTLFNGKSSFTLKEAIAFLKNNIGLSGKPIENFEAKVGAAIDDPWVKTMIARNGKLSDTLRFFAEEPTVNMIQANPRLFLFPSNTSSAQSKAFSVSARFCQCKSIQDFIKLVIDAKSVGDCNFITNALVGTNATEVRKIAEIKADILAEQLNNESLAKKIGEASKAYVSAQLPNKLLHNTPKK